MRQRITQIEMLGCDVKNNEDCDVLYYSFDAKTAAT
jgi:hypothetical protein